MKSGEFGADESYFGASMVRGTRSDEPLGRHQFTGCQTWGKVFVKAVENCS